jgi:hypothetical protein
LGYTVNPSGSITWQLTGGAKGSGVIIQEVLVQFEHGGVVDLLPLEGTERWVIPGGKTLTGAVYDDVVGAALASGDRAFVTYTARLYNNPNYGSAWQKGGFPSSFQVPSVKGIASFGPSSSTVTRVYEITP